MKNIAMSLVCRMHSHRARDAGVDAKSRKAKGALKLVGGHLDGFMLEAANFRRKTEASTAGDPMTVFPASMFL